MWPQQTISFHVLLLNESCWLLFDCIISRRQRYMLHLSVDLNVWRFFNLFLMLADWPVLSALARQARSLRKFVFAGRNFQRVLLIFAISALNNLRTILFQLKPFHQDLPRSVMLLKINAICNCLKVIGE